MFTQRRTRRRTALTFILLIGLASTVFGVQDKAKQKKSKVMPQGTPVLWRDPGDISSRDLFTGPGGEASKPDLSNVTFVREATGGFSPKFRVRDGAGKIWIAKFGSEAQPETSATRLAWAIGYQTEINYLYPCVQIKGAPPPKKSVDRCEGQGFANVRFEARPKELKRFETWSWTGNPFTGTKEFKGLIVLMALFNNWDLKDTNNIIVAAKGDDGQNELRYIISDLGATFGKTGNFISRSRNKPRDYAKSGFIKSVEGGRVRFAYSGKNSGLFSNITVAEAKWLGNLLSRLSDQQLNDAFRAANYSPEDIQLLTEAVRAHINQLVNLAG